jgi:hypothetical protein
VRLLEYIFMCFHQIASPKQLKNHFCEIARHVIWLF